MRGCTEVRVGSTEDVRALLRTVRLGRKVSTTRCNARSSRSHVIFRIELQRCKSFGGEGVTSGTRLRFETNVFHHWRLFSVVGGPRHTRAPSEPVAVLSFIDLAGSERNSVSWTSGKELTVRPSFHLTCLAVKL